MLDFLGAPLAGLGFNLYQDWLYNQQFDQFQNEQVDPYNQQLQGIAGVPSQIYNRAQSLVGGISNQETADVNQRFDQEGASQLMRLSERGLGGSTIAPSISYANERNRSDELRRVNDERLMRMLGVENTFGLGGLGTQLQALDQQIFIPPGRGNPVQIQPQFKP